MLLALLLAERPEAPTAGQRHRRLPFALLRVRIKLLIEAGHRLVERVVVDAGRAGLLTGEPARSAAPMQRARLGLGEGLVVDHAGGDELRDYFGDHALDVVDDRRVRRLRPTHPTLEHTAQPFGG